MTWTFQEIEGDWLQGDRLVLSPEVVVEAFNRVEAVLGRD